MVECAHRVGRPEIGRTGPGAFLVSGLQTGRRAPG